MGPYILRLKSEVLRPFFHKKLKKGISDIESGRQTLQRIQIFLITASSVVLFNMYLAYKQGSSMLLNTNWEAMARNANIKF